MCFILSFLFSKQWRRFFPVLKLCTNPYRAEVCRPPWRRRLPPRGSVASCRREAAPCAASSRREAVCPPPRPASRCRHLNQRKSELTVNNTLGCPRTLSTGSISTVVSHYTVNGVYFHGGFPPQSTGFISTVVSHHTVNGVYFHGGFPPQSTGFISTVVFHHSQRGLFYSGFHLHCQRGWFPWRVKPAFYGLFFSQMFCTGETCWLRLRLTAK